MELTIKERSSKINAKVLLEHVSVAFTLTCEESRCFSASCFYFQHCVAAMCVRRHAALQFRKNRSETMKSAKSAK